MLVLLGRLDLLELQAQPVLLGRLARQVQILLLRVQLAQQEQQVLLAHLVQLARLVQVPLLLARQVQQGLLAQGQLAQLGQLDLPVLAVQLKLKIRERLLPLRQQALILLALG